MKKFYVVLIASLLSCLNGVSQSVSFGMELMPRQNIFTGGLKEEDLNNYLNNGKSSYLTPQFSVIDTDDDTLNFYFSKAKSMTSFELPFYLRYRTKKRWFFDFSFAISKISIQMNGKTAYSEASIERWYDKGSYTDSLLYYNPGFSEQEVDSAYQSYIGDRRQAWINDFSYHEDFKLRSFSFLAGYRFAPHKAFKPYVQVGFSIKRQVSNYLVQNFTFKDNYILDQDKISQGIPRFPQTKLCFRLGAGVETYRFRAGVLFDATWLISEAAQRSSDKRIINLSADHPYGGFLSLGFYVGSDLIFYDLASKKQLNKEITDFTEVPKIKMKNDKWSLGLRINNSLNCNVNGYYSDNTPLNVLTYKYFNGTYGYSGSWTSVADIKMVSIKNVKLVDHRPQVEGFFRKNFFGKVLLEANAGYNNLKVDFETTELRSRVITRQRSNGDYYWDYDGKPSLYSGVYRKSYDIYSVGANLAFQFVTKDFIKMRVWAGASFNYMSGKSLEVNKAERINSTDLIRDFDTWAERDAPDYATKLTSGEFLAFSQGDLGVDVYQPADSVINQVFIDEVKFIYLSNNKDYVYDEDNQQFKPKQSAKSFFGAYRIGLEAEINRFSLGLFYQANMGYLNGILLSNYNTFSFSIGYVLLKR
jgi:hypothetical protein